MLVLKENEVSRHADYVPKFRTIVIKSKVTVGLLQMGYVVTS